MEEKICPQCKTANPMAANFCRHCRHEFSEASKNGQSLSPVIKFFRIVEPKYTIGSTIHLEWEVENADEVLLSGEPATGCNNAETVVEKPMKAVLVAKNDYTETKRELRISPEPLPKVILFRVSSNNILQGQKVKLEWKVSGSRQVEVVTEEGAVVGKGENSFIHLTPTKTSTYRLKCYAKDDDSITVEREERVEVLEAVQILDFAINKDNIIESEKALLTWNVKNATTIEISPPLTDVTRLKKLEVCPKRATEYRLTARNAMSVAEASVTIGVQELPKFEKGKLGSLAEIKLPECKLDGELLPQIVDSKEVDIAKWMMNPSAKMDVMSSWLNSFPRLVKKILNKPLQT